MGSWMLGIGQCSCSIGGPGEKNHHFIFIIIDWQMIANTGGLNNIFISRIMMMRMTIRTQVMMRMGDREEGG